MTTTAYGLEPITAYTDGACLGNPGPGGWGIVIRDSRAKLIACGHCPDSTNNRMELQAVLETLNAIRQTTRPLIIVTDSLYVSKGVTEWLPRWKAGGWRTASRKPVANQDLWQELDALLANRAGPVEWRWVRGHSGHPGNDEADALAYRGAHGETVRQRTVLEVAA
ncbi:ribonuclease HI [Synechococcus moorigangaii CMS01]|nr:ribonuclease HI [Synechococcus moorigangaii CMS01]